MAKDLTVILEDQPGELAALGEATGQAGINIEGMCALTSEGRGVIHILVEDPATARRALADVGLDIAEERDALVVDVEDRPGMMADVAQRVAAARVNIECAYTTFGGVRLVIVPDDIERARAAI